MGGIGTKVALVVVGLAAAGGALSLIPVGGNMDKQAIAGSPRPPAVDLSGFSSDAPASHPSLVFLHHSIGEHWLADPNTESDSTRRHKNGGGLRRALEKSGYEVHDATYGSALGENTDLFDWLPKFTGHMDEVLRIRRQDEKLPEGQHNQIVMFKSCFPNGYFAGPGAEPGNPAGPTLTLANAKATFRALLPIFEKHPDTLFVFVTTPPFNGDASKEKLGKVLLKRVLGRPSSAERLTQQGTLAREFHDWVLAQDGWLAGYPAKNVVVFDFYDILTKGRSSLFLAYPSAPYDSHPSSEGNRLATSAFVPFLNRALHRWQPAPTAAAAP
jgi:hypothetical protein